jgi:hypothetical protein
MQNNLDSLRRSQHIQSEPMEYMRTIQNSPVSKYDARIFYKKELARNMVNAKSIQRTPNSKFNDLMSRKKGIRNERNQLIYGSKEGLISHTLSPNNNNSKERIRAKGSRSPNSPKLPSILEKKGYDTTFYPEEVRISLQPQKKNPYL